MRAESATIQARVPLQHQEYGSTIRQGALKRKHPSDEVASRKLGEISYPSPPMSSPPSPSGTQFQLPVSGSRDPVQVRTSREGPITSLGSVLAASLPSAQGPAPPALFPQSSVFPGFITAPLSIHSIEPLQSATHPFDPVGQPSQCVQSGRPRLDANVTTTQPASCTPAVDTPSSARRGRKAKAHVASACVNCKRAHLSCDVQRPCARCVATGKQVSIVVPHRGSLASLMVYLGHMFRCATQKAWTSTLAGRRRVQSRTSGIRSSISGIFT